MALSDKQKEAVAIVKDLMLNSGHKVIAVVGVSMLDHLEESGMTPREKLAKIHAEVMASEHGGGCNCEARHQCLVDILTHLEKQNLKDEIIESNLSRAVVALREFEAEFDRVPTITYVASEYVIDSGVAGVYFIHPAAQK